MFTGAPPPLEALVLDEQRMMGQAIAGVLAEVAGLEVLGICSSSTEACALIRQRPPRLLVLDLHVGSERYRDAADLLHQLRPEAQLLFLTSLTAAFNPPADLAASTLAVVDKTQAWDALVAVLQSWLQHLPELQLQALPGCAQQLCAIKSLTPRERRLLLELGNGQLNKQMAARLGLSPATVETYRKHVAAKLSLSGGELVRLAVLYRWLRWDQITTAE